MEEEKLLENVKDVGPYFEQQLKTLEELPIAAEVRDDFGITKVGLSYTFAQTPPKDLTLGEEISRGAKTKLEHLIEFEELKAEPDQVVVVIGTP